MSSIKYPLLFPGFATSEDHEDITTSDRLQRQEAATYLFCSKQTSEQLKTRMKKMADERIGCNTRGQAAIDWWQPIYEEVLRYTLENESRGPVSQAW